jgi:hypothetical protein
MVHPDRVNAVAADVTSGIRLTLGRVGRLVRGVAVIAVLIGLATFLTGWWVFDGSAGWLLIGGALCALPAAAAIAGWWMVTRTARTAGNLVSDVRTLLTSSKGGADVLVDYDSGQSIAVTSRSFGNLRQELSSRRTELPDLFAGVKAITSVPALAAIALLGILLLGMFGTVLLLAGLIA